MIGKIIVQITTKENNETRQSEVEAMREKVVRDWIWFDFGLAENMLLDLLSHHSFKWWSGLIDNEK